MKRISIAEQTLKKQIDRIKADIRQHERQMDIHKAVTKELYDQVSVLECEKDILQTARERASIRNSPSKIRAI